jgi:outer membrane protein assembly factor BamD
MPQPRRRPAALLGALALAALGTLGCHSETFNQKLQKQPSNEARYRLAMQEYQRKHWDNAIAAFDKLTIELPARDTLLPRCYYYLGMAHVKNGENLLAAQSFTRLPEAFPDDTLADDAIMEAAKAYARLWRRPSLDPQYGQTALSTYRTLLGMYPNSPLRDRATREIARLENMLATKDYEAGMFYLRRKAFDSAIIYFRDVIRNYPSSSRTKDAYLRLVQAYRAIHYRDDAAEACDAVRRSFPTDAAVRRMCGAATDTAKAPSQTTP